VDIQTRLVERVTMRTWKCLTGLSSLFVLATLAACDGSGSGSSRSSALPILGQYSVFVTIRNEIEPNNDLAEANAYTLPDHNGNADYVGFGVKGSIDDTDDPADYFVFTTSRAHPFSIKLCPVIADGVPSCGPIGTKELIDTSIAYFEVLDQDGVLLLSSQGDVSAGNSQEINLDAGAAYYLAVFADDTVDAARNYLIETVERPPLP
jgi:hypothetical protein